MQQKQTSPETFVIPQLIPDDEPDSLIDQYASTDPGVAGFSYRRPDRAPSRQQPSSDRRTGREVSQHRSVLAEFQEMARQAELKREQGDADRATIHQLGGHALGTPPDRY